MRVVHLSYAIPKPEFTEPEKWLKRIGFAVIVMEAMTPYADVVGIYHIQFRGVVQKNGVTFHLTNYSRLQLLLPFKFHRYLKQLAPDAVIIHGLISPWQVIMLRWAVGPRVKILIEHHAERPLKDVRQYLQRWADRYVKAYMFGSLALGKIWVDKKQIRDVSKVKEIVGTSSIFQPGDKTFARESIGVKPGTMYLWVGRLDSNKDPWIVVKAFDRFARLHSDVNLHMVYSIAEAEFELDEMLNKVGPLTPHIHFVGEVIHDDLQCWYNSADFIISSSHYEGSGISVCEALSCGCIPILTNIPSFTRMTDNGRIGILYPGGNEEALFQALTESLSIDRQDQREQVLRWYRAMLSPEAVARKIMDLIDEASNE